MRLHCDPDRSRAATAPYNFIRLPRKVFWVTEGIATAHGPLKPWEHHDEFLPGTHSGWIDLEITALTPLFIRGPVARRAHGWDAREARLRGEPFLDSSGRPVIPGSSLRGMIRTLVEILGFARVQPVTRQKPFFRTVDVSRLGRAYRQRMVQGATKPQGGYLERRGSDWCIAPCQVARVERTLLEKMGVTFSDRNYKPSWKFQHRKVWVKVERNVVETLSFNQRREPGWSEGTLVLTGNSPRKKHEFVFYGQPGEPVAIPETLWERFHDDDQITQWQQQAFPRNEPKGAHRPAAGALREGEPVFFLCRPDEVDPEANPHGLVFFGRAQMFRLPYDCSPYDLLPEEHKAAGLDLAEAMFGRVAGQKTDGPTLKGRVVFADAVAIGDHREWLDPVLVPNILSSPKPTCFPHYLVQDSSAPDQLRTYLREDGAEVRGHKLYWHRSLPAGQVAAADQQALLKDLSSNCPQNTQHCLMRPVKKDVRFRGRIRFSNLTDLELGALLAAVRLPPECAHKIGMAKPLGFGSIRVTPTLTLIDRSRRYEAWNDEGAKSADPQSFIERFAEAMLAHARKAGEPMVPEKRGLESIERLSDLYLMLNWQSRPAWEKTATMPLQEFRERKVLPSPLMVATEKPRCPQPPPSLPTPAREPPSSMRSPPPVQPQKQVSQLQKGKTIKGQLQRDAQGQWVSVFPSETTSAIITNAKDIPSETEDGARAEFFVVESAKKQELARIRFVKILKC
ncbi:MAG: DUF324 domain-containing protein [Candidatus Ozemobacter sibiricus]|uniref:DUF324 domain-containing protein n=1 Tax=Candidatus Ozemobacter sibiricus TaxID=2268124 RepID=A0A367ZKH0_9BACT|nr:MAG: DUF324 domain-containing protein [Candidatus Ozemobacter sibiricus]